MDQADLSQGLQEASEITYSEASKERTYLCHVRLKRLPEGGRAGMRGYPVRMRVRVRVYSFVY